MTRLLPLEKLYVSARGFGPRSWRTYVASGAIVAVAAAIRMALDSWLVGTQYITFFPALIIITFLFGTVAGFFGLALAVLAAWYFILPPSYSFTILSPGEVHGLFLFAVAASANVAMTGGLRLAVARVRDLNVTLRSSEAKFRGLLESSPDATVIIDRRGRITLVNSRAEALYGYRREELLGQPIELLVPEPYRSRHAGHVAAFMAAPTGRAMGKGAELPGMRRDGSTFLTEVALSPLQTEDGLLVSSVVRDITSRKRVEADLVEAKRVAEEASRAKSAFLARMSHELRTPLNAVIGFSQMQQLVLGEAIPAKYREYADYILMSGNHLLELVNDVLDLSGIESGRLRLKIDILPIRGILETVRDTMAPLAEQAGIRLDVTLPQVALGVQADDLRLRQVLINLVSNAIKYNRPGGTVTLGVASPDRQTVRFTVADTGIGIPLDRQPELFQPFQRLGAEQTRVEGTGMGLVLSKKLVESMSGTMGFASVAGEGSSFWFELPAEPADAADIVALGAPAPGETRPASGGFSLLYVEDDPPSLRLVERLAATLPDIAMLTAPTAQLGIDMAIAHRPDIILLDLSLPGFDGFEVLARLKATKETRDIPVLALTAAAFPRDIEKGLAAGFFRYITKPLDVRAFLTALDEALAEAAARRNSTEQADPADAVTVFVK